MTGRSRAYGRLIPSNESLDQILEDDDVVDRQELLEVPMADDVLVEKAVQLGVATVRTEEDETSGEDQASPTAPHTEQFLVEFCTCSFESLPEGRTSLPFTVEEEEEAGTGPDPILLEAFPPLC